MRCVTVREAGGPEVLVTSEVATPRPLGGEVRIEVEAAGISRADALQRRGLYPPPAGASPLLGLEVAGTVVEVGEDAGAYSVGDRVVALCNGGGYCEFVTVPQGQVLPLPQQWSFVEGATLPENAFTVYDNVIVRARLKRGEILLVHGGTSGIGTTAMQYALALGATVIATAGTEAKCEAIREMGASAAINYREEDFVERVLNLTNKRGADVILNIVGGDYIDRDLRALAIDGRIACIATSGGATATIDLRYLLQKRATILGSSLRPRSAQEKEEIARGLLRDIWPLLPARNPIKPIIDSIYTFTDAAEAHTRLESSAHIGKIVLVPDAPKN